MDGRIRSLKLCAMLAATTILTYGVASPAWADPVGFVEHAFVIEGGKLTGRTSWSEVAHVERAGRRMSRLAQRISLEPGDRVIVDKPGYVVFFHRFSDNSLVQIWHGFDWRARGNSLKGLLGASLVWLEQVLSCADQSRIAENGLATLGTRGGGLATACYNEKATSSPTDFAMPIFAAQQSVISSAHRTLVIP